MVIVTVSIIKELMILVFKLSVVESIDQIYTKIIKPCGYFDEIVKPVKTPAIINLFIENFKN